MPQINGYSKVAELLKTAVSFFEGEEIAEEYSSGFAYRSTTKSRENIFEMDSIAVLPSWSAYHAFENATESDPPVFIRIDLNKLPSSTVFYTGDDPVIGLLKGKDITQESVELFTLDEAIKLQPNLKEAYVAEYLANSMLKDKRES
jgi:hypothetical protein